MVINIKQKELEKQLENGNANYCRIDDWKYDYSISVLNIDGNINKFESRIAKYRIVNNINEKGNIEKYRIILDNDNKILWIGSYRKKRYFISCRKKLYELGYRHKYLHLFPNICFENTYFDEEDNNSIDDFIKKHRNNIGRYRYGNIENIKNIFFEEKIGIIISLEEYFEKGFFYKGFKWNKNWEEYYGYDYITILIDIIVKDELFFIEIENITYPFYGYILLDLNELKIIEAKKMKAPNFA